MKSSEEKRLSVGLAVKSGLYISHSFGSSLELEEEVNVPPVSSGEGEAGNVHHEGELESFHEVSLGEVGTDELGPERAGPDGDGEKEAFFAFNFTLEGGELLSVLVFAGLHVEIYLKNNYNCRAV